MLHYVRLHRRVRYVIGATSSRQAPDHGFFGGAGRYAASTTEKATSVAAIRMLPREAVFV